MPKLWQKKGQRLNPIIERYTVGSDFVLDKELMPFDIQATEAHVRALGKTRVLMPSEVTKITSCLGKLQKDFKSGKVRISRSDEDCHTVIENFLTKKLGDIGKKVHTGRSRNDQVLVALRLYMKHHLEALRRECAQLALKFLKFADRYKNVAMPGYSHTQQAMLSSVGHYFCAYAESLLDDAEFLNSVSRHIDKNPLGSAAGFGTSVPLDREFTTKTLGFSGIQLNTLYCQNSRGKFESVFLEGVVQVMMTLARFATDLLLFTSQEFDFFSVDSSLVTGSSIMPQKRNLDVLEIMRANASVVIGNQLTVKEISKNLLSGYNRDLQLIKKPLFESAAVAHNSLEVAAIVLRGITPNERLIRAKISRCIFAADVANELVKSKGVPFRDAYRQALAHLATETPDLRKNLASKKTLGAPGNLQIKGLKVKAARLLK